MRVALYARVSTSDQDADLQLVELHRYVAACGWIVVEEFVDHDVSGSLASRPALGRLRAAARRRDVDAVVAAMAEFEREILREGVRAGMARARERGVRLGRPLKLDAPQILSLSREGISVRAIARRLGAPASTVADALKRRA